MLLDAFGIVVLAAAVAVLAFTLPVYWVSLVSATAISTLLARSVGVVSGVGLITLCQMSFAAIGGWAVSQAALTWPGIPFLAVVIGGGLLSGLVGLAVGLATVRVRGVEFAVVSLGLAAGLDLVLRQGSFPGVGSGTPVLPEAPFTDPRWFSMACWAVVIVAQCLVWAAGRARTGRSWPAVRFGERAAAALGVRVGWSKATALATGALLAGLGGGLLAGQYGLLTADVFGPLVSLSYLATAVLCGAGLFGGAVLAGILVVFLPELLERVGLPLDLANLLLALGAFDVLRRGDGGLAEHLRDVMSRRRFRNARVDADLTAAAARLPTGEVSAGRPRAGTAHGVAAAPAPPLTIEHLSASFGGVRALVEVSITIEGGNVHAVIGPNGAGKTTLVEAVTGYLAEAHGEVRIGTHRFAAAGRGPGSVRRRVAAGLRRTFQQCAVVETMRVGDYLRLAAQPAGDRWALAHRATHTRGRQASRRQAAARRESVRRYFALPADDVPIHFLDYASKRALEIAATLVSEPKLILLDEPTAGVEDVDRAALAALIAGIPSHFGCAVLLIEHHMDFVSRAARTATYLELGRAVLTAPVAGVLADRRVRVGYLGDASPPRPHSR
ncbi:ATP-binding cassette domain-containing protein [Microbacterium sp.]|uniref:ATP-binding cassette domain-containing protein n=1 Tax=Microbacterium sp. TaxID=51671 RepID=UPI003A865DAB